MAEEQKNSSQKGMGELFIDLGVKGLPTLLKSLNSVSATFLLAKNGAEQLAQPLNQFTKTASDNVVGLDKLNSVTGITVDKLQDLKKWSQLNNVSFSDLTSQIIALQQNLLNIKMGKGGNLKGFALLGLDPREMDYNEPLEALTQIKDRVLQLDEATSVLAMHELGLSEELLYAWRQQNEEYNKSLNLTKEEIEEIRKQNQAVNSLKVTWSSFWDKVIAKGTWFRNLVISIRKLLEFPFMNKEEQFNTLNSGFKKGAKFVLKEIKNPTPLKLGQQTGDFLFDYAKYNVKKFFNHSSETVPSKKISNPFINEPNVLKPKDINYSYPNNLGSLPPLPNLPTDNSSNINIEVTQNIHSTDPVLAGKEAANSISDLDLNTLQNINNFGI